MEVEYNPQVGIRRTLFDESYDFLVGIDSWETKENQLILYVRTHQDRLAVVKAEFLTGTAFRFQMFPEGTEQTAKNPVFSPKEKMKATLHENEEWLEYGTEQTTIRFQKAYWQMEVRIGDRCLTKEQVFDTNVDNRWKMLPIGYHMDDQGKCQSVHETMYLYSDESFWGFGEKFTDLNKRGQMLHCWQKDALSTNTEDSYKGHPFFISSRGYAILLNTFTRCSFDMGHTSAVSYRMETEDAYLDYILFAQPETDYKAVLRQYIKLAGEIPMIPKWAFGFWMSRCSYRSRQEIEEIVQQAELHDIPIDVIHIDGWQQPDMNGTWEWDRERFPDPEGMIQWLKEHHVRLSLWNYPYVNEDSPMFSELEEKGYFIRNTEGKTALFLAMADAPVLSACFDFTNPEFQQWYEQRVSAVLEMGVAVIKTDFSEAVPENVVFYDGSSGIEGHNRLTWLYAKTIYDIMKKCGQKTGNMPMLWGRSGYAGSHMVPAAWAGDSSGALNNHSAILKGGLSLAASGVSFWGYDLGGFYNTASNGDECLPTDEEYLRSLELGVMMPLSRAHGKTPREPWNFSEEVLNISRLYIKGRHKIVPYLYSTACESHVQSVPMLRPLYMEFPDDPCASMQELSCMLGDNLLIAAPFDRDEYQIYLPQGAWLNLGSGEIVDGGRYVKAAPKLDELPVFQRANTILPMVSDAQCGHVPEGTFENIEVQLFYQSDFSCTFYDEDSQSGIQEYYFKAFQDEEGSLRIETDMKIQKIHLKTMHSIVKMYLNGHAV